MNFYSTLLRLPSSDSTVSEDARTEPRTVATFPFTAGRSYHSEIDFIHQSTRSHPQLKNKCLIIAACNSLIVK
jgi:hypothetical protein